MLNQQIKCSEISVKWLENMGVESLSWDSVLFLSLASFSFLGSLLNSTIQLKGDNKTYFSGCSEGEVRLT